MRKALILSMVAIFIMGAFAFAAAPPIYSWDSTNSAWTKVTVTAIASVTANETWTSAADDGILDPSYSYGGVRYSILPGTPTWTKIPTITWNLHVSQWIYISIQYFNYNIHVDLPGDYVVDSLSIHVQSNGGVFTYFNTGGWLADNSAEPAHTIPTWAGYTVDEQANPTVGLPATGVSTDVWHDFAELDGMFTPEEPLTVGGPCFFENTFYIWFGFRVGEETCKGDYTTYADIYIQSDP